METFIKVQQCFKVLNYFKTNAKNNAILYNMMDLDLFGKCLKLCLVSSTEFLIANSVLIRDLF